MIQCGEGTCVLAPTTEWGSRVLLFNSSGASDSLSPETRRVHFLRSLRSLSRSLADPRERCAFAQSRRVHDFAPRVMLEQCESLLGFDHHPGRPTTEA